MEALKTIPQLQHNIMEILKSWRIGTDPIFPDELNSPFNDNIRCAFKIQREVGISAMFNRLLMREWGEVKNVYYRTEVCDKKLNIIC